MVVNFRSLNYYLQLQIAPKMELSDFIQFVPSCKHSYSLSKTMHKRVTKKINSLTFYGNFNNFQFHDDGLPLDGEFNEKVKNVPIRLSIKRLIASFHLNDENCQTIINFFMKTLSSCEKFVRSCVWFPTSSPDTVSKVLEAGHVQNFHSRLIAPEFLCTPAVFKLKGLKANWAIEDKELLQLEASSLKLTNTLVSSKAINEFIKQWVIKKREIRHVLIFAAVPFTLSTILEDLDYALGFQVRLQDHDYEIQRPGEKNFLLLQVGKCRIEISRHTATCHADDDCYNC